MNQSGTIRWQVATALLVIVVALSMISQPGAAQSETEPAFIVDLNADGSAEVSVRSTFDLTTDAEQEAFLTLMNDEEAQANAKARFLDRMRLVADDAENATGREMRVSDPSIDLTRTSDNETGVITLSVTWSGLAATDGDSLVITEPFASGFTTERAFHLRAPDGYQVSVAAPEPDEDRGNSVSWEPGTDLDGFSVELQPASTTDDGADEATRTGGQPGFGVLTTMLSVLMVAGMLAIRRTHQSEQEGETS